MSGVVWNEGPLLVRVPATSANLGPGFDALGLALSLHDDVEARVTAGGLSLDVSGEGAAEVAAAGEKHLIVRVMRAAFDDLGVGQPAGLALRCVNRIPHGRGLGSSAAAIVAGVLAARALAGASLRAEDALPLACGFEGHPDNVAPCLFGGLTIAWLEGGNAQASPAAGGSAHAFPAADGTAPAFPAAGGSAHASPAAGGSAPVSPGAGRAWGAPARAIRLEPLADLRLVVFIAPEPVSTAVARGLLPASVPHADAARNAGRAALLVAALTAHPEALLDATEDLLHQDYRAPAMPATHDLVRRLRAAGIPAVVSGAGPSVLAFATGAARQAGAAAGGGSGAYLDKLGSITKEAGIDWRVSPLGVERHGASVEPGAPSIR